MFVLGFKFEKEMGNEIPDDKVIEKLDAAVDMTGVKGFTFRYGKSFENETKYDKVDTFLAKALTHYCLEDNASKEEKYLIYTNRYQMSEISKKIDTDSESKDLCKLFDSMELFKVTAQY